MKLSSWFSKNRPYLIIVGAFLVQLSIGRYYTSGSVQMNIIDYMKNYSSSGNSVGRNNSVWIFGLLVFGMGSAVTAGGYLAKKIGTPFAIIIGGWIMSLNVILGYFTVKSYLSIMAISFGLLAGIGAGLAYGIALGAPIKWFPNHKGLVIGIVASGFGLAQVIFVGIQKSIINKNIETLEFLPISFVVLGCSYATLQVIGSILLKDCDLPRTPCSREITTQCELDQKNYSSLFRFESRPTSSDTQLKPHELIFEFDFWILWLTFLFVCSSSTIITSMSKQFGDFILKKNRSNILTIDQSYKNLVIINIIGGLSNVCGRICWGYLATLKPYKVIMIVLAVINALFMGSLYFLIYIPDNTTRIILFGLWIAIINFCLGGIFAVFPTICEQLFGMNDFACNYGLLLTADSITAIIVSTIAVVFESQGEKLCMELFLIGSVMSLIGAGFTLLFRGKSLIVSRY